VHTVSKTWSRQSPLPSLTVGLLKSTEAKSVARASARARFRFNHFQDFGGPQSVASTVLSSGAVLVWNAIGQHALIAILEERRKVSAPHFLFRRSKALTNKWCCSPFLPGCVMRRGIADLTAKAFPPKHTSMQYNKGLQAAQAGDLPAQLQAAKGGQAGGQRSFPSSGLGFHP
jgi:hypothetical protein